MDLGLHGMRALISGASDGIGVSPTDCGRAALQWNARLRASVFRR